MKKVLKGEGQNREFPFLAEERSYFIIRSSRDAVKRFFIGNAPDGLPSTPVQPSISREGRAQEGATHGAEFFKRLTPPGPRKTRVSAQSSSKGDSRGLALNPGYTQNPGGKIDAPVALQPWDSSAPRIQGIKLSS